MYVVMCIILVFSRTFVFHGNQIVHYLISPAFVFHGNQIVHYLIFPCIRFSW
jgi:hypothetical protein